MRVSKYFCLLNFIVRCCCQPRSEESWQALLCQPQVVSKVSKVIMWLYWKFSRSTEGEKAGSWRRLQLGARLVEHAVSQADPQLVKPELLTAQSGGRRHSDLRSVSSPSPASHLPWGGRAGYLGWGWLWPSMWAEPGEDDLIKLVFRWQSTNKLILALFLLPGGSQRGWQLNKYRQSGLRRTFKKMNILEILYLHFNFNFHLQSFNF